MDIRAHILKRILKKGRVSVHDVARSTGLSRSYLNRFFKRLRAEGEIALIGKANQAHYVPAASPAIMESRNSVGPVHFLLKNKNLEEDRVLQRVKKSNAVLAGLPANVEKILQYAFTEMLNNAIEHSRSEDVDIKVERSVTGISFSISDQGIGIFNNIMTERNLATPLDAIGELLKGKQTTAPQAHSGEGIFFTSKVADRLLIRSGQKKLIFDNRISDVSVGDCALVRGTKVHFTIELSSSRQLEGVFKNFSNDAFEFSRTRVDVKLFEMGREFMSRSQARRILSGLEAFEVIALDFSGIGSVGQAFADEIFRVWKNRFPEKKVVVVNSNENIDFMIKRADR